MRLLHTSQLKFQEFIGRDIPHYAILSHTWGHEEVDYQEMMNPSQTTSAKSGYQKVLKAAEVSQRMGYDYLWLDTCNIDKRSSAELTEAINSMYRWYAKSGVCLAYMADVELTETPADFGNTNFKLPSGFGRSRWFTRGWTLQELIAPLDLLFLSKDWDEIAWKREIDLSLTEITGIPSKVFKEPFQSKDWAVAEKMSWVSKRRTTRPEDIAYCMLGLFNVNMALLYGEGERAFIRLQEEIMKQTDDHTIFLWSSKDSDPCCYRGLLAPDPEKFSNCRGMELLDDAEIGTTPFSMTNAGLRLDLPLLPWASFPPDTVWSNSDTLLDIGKRNIFIPKFINTNYSILLLRLGEGKNQYARIAPGKRIYIEEEVLLDQAAEIERSHRCFIRQELRIPQDHIAPGIPLFFYHETTTSQNISASWAAAKSGRAVTTSDTMLMNGRISNGRAQSSINLRISLLGRLLPVIRVVPAYEPNTGKCFVRLHDFDSLHDVENEAHLEEEGNHRDKYYTSDLEYTATVFKEIREGRLVISTHVHVDRF